MTELVGDAADDPDDGIDGTVLSYWFSLYWRSIDPHTIPLQAYGIVDPGVSGVDDSQMLAHALANTAFAGLGSYAVQQGSMFVNEYPRRDDGGSLTIGTPDNLNHLLGAFPFLFPYGMGGFEVERMWPVSYEAHVAWALRYADRWFRLDTLFCFQTFGVIQKHQICRSAVLQVKKRDFTAFKHAFWQLKPENLRLASVEEDKHVQHSNSIVCSLKHHISAVRSKVMGTDESRTAIWSYIWGMTVMKGPLSLWITINPMDTHDPVVQVFTGADINLDQFDHITGPDAATRAFRIAHDPYAAAKFFHFTINAILDSFFGILRNSRGDKIEWEGGIFGVDEGYVETVEVQGWGTLHLHMLLWLKGAPTSAKMKQLLQSDIFRSRIVDFIALNIWGHHEAISEETLSTIPKETAMSYSHPFDARDDHDSTQSSGSTEEKTLQAKLLCAVQIHKCSSCCLKMKKGRLVCKCHAPFPVANSAWINSEGEWGPKRTYEYLNNWVPPLLLGTRSNHGAKLITNGVKTNDITFYLTQYVAKKQQWSSNALTLLTKSLAFHKEKEKYTLDVNLVNKHLIKKCVNTLSREQKFSGPEVISYLMGWGDWFISHHFEPIHFSSVIGLLKKTYPHLVPSWWVTNSQKIVCATETDMLFHLSVIA